MFEARLAKRRGDFALRADLALAPGGVLALFGRSGCGKTTCIDLIAGLVEPDAAYIALDGEVLVDTTRGVRRPIEQRRLGYVFQDARLFPHLTVVDNLRYGERRRAPAAGRRAPALRFEPMVEMLGLEALLARRPGQLSGGERQRVALGRALLSQPGLLLLDEPLASLDGERREEVLPYLERLRHELALPIIYVTHQYEEVLRLATDMVLLEAGQILLRGSPPELSLDPALRRIVGPEASGAVLEGEVTAVESTVAAAELRLGAGTLRVSTGVAAVRPGERMRVQLLARDLILATVAPQGLSVRNALRGRLLALEEDGPDALLARVALDGAPPDAGAAPEVVLARITPGAAQALALEAGCALWVLVKAASTRGHAFRSPGPPSRSPS